MTYCKRCKIRTNSQFNEYFVEFCTECRTVKGYHKQRMPFDCIICGAKVEESYVGQTVCDDCLKAGEIPF